MAKLLTFGESFREGKEGNLPTKDWIAIHDGCTIRVTHAWTAGENCTLMEIVET
jgi:hypothetical protein